MLNCKVFKSPEFGDIRTMIDGAGAPLFIASDIAAVLFESKSHNAFLYQCKHTVKVPHPSISKKEVYAIDPIEVSRLCVKSKKTKSLDFHDWIFEKVIPELKNEPVEEDITEEQKEQNWQEQERNKQNLSDAELILSIAKQNVSTEKRILSLERNVENLLSQFGYAKDIDQYYSTIAGYIQRFNLPVMVNQYAHYGARAADICRRRGIKISKISDLRYGTINVYPNFILQELFKKSFK